MLRALLIALALSALSLWVHPTHAQSPGTLALVGPSSRVTLNTASDTASGSTLAFASTSGVVVNAAVSGPNIAPGVTVASFVPNVSVSLSSPVMGDVPGGSPIVFTPPPVTPQIINEGVNAQLGLKFDATGLPAALASPPPIGSVTPGPVSTRAIIDAADPRYAGGMKCDSPDGISGTDDTAAFQAAIIAADANHTHRTLLVPGNCKITGVIIHAPVIVRCGSLQAPLWLASGSTQPAVSLQITAADWTDTTAMADVMFDSCHIKSPNRADGPGQTVAHGFAFNGLASPTLSTERLILWHDQITNMPGDCVHHDQVGGGTGRMLVRAYETECTYPNGNGVSCNSGSDWQWWGGPIYGAGINNVLLSGCVNVRFHGVNAFIAAQNDISLFDSDLEWDGGFVDLTGTNGLQINNAGGASADFIGTRFRWPSTASNNTYSNIRFTATNTGSVYCTNCRFDDPSVVEPGSGNRALDNVHFVAGNTGSFYGSNTRFDAGDQLIGAVTNSAGNMMNAPGTMQVPARVIVRSSTQFDGFTVNNGTNQVAALVGNTAANDNGSLQLLSAGVADFGMQAGAQGQYKAMTLSSQAIGRSTSGGSATVGNLQELYLLDSGVNATFAITTAPAPNDGQVLWLQCAKSVTALTVTPNAGQSMVGTASACSTTQGHRWRYLAATTSWWMDY